MDLLTLQERKLDAVLDDEEREDAAEELLTELEQGAERAEVDTKWAGVDGMEQAECMQVLE